MPILPVMFKINEIYPTILGESLYTGYPFIIVRFTGCPLRCSWCDTQYAYYEGNDYSLAGVMDEIAKFKYFNILLTGGEPLAQNNLEKLIDQLLQKKYQIVVETSGALPVSVLAEKVHLVMDYKLPSSGMENKMMLKQNLNYLKTSDEIKFPVADKKDFNRAIEIIEESKLLDKVKIAVSPVMGKIDFSALAELILSSKMNIRLNLQIHKIIWPEISRGR